MRWTSILALAISAGCGSSEILLEEIHYEEVRSWNGLSVELFLLDASPVLGQPFHIRLDLKDSSSRPTFYSAQAVSYGGFDLMSPQGTGALQFASFIPRFEKHKPISPGETVNLAKDLDLTTQFLVDVSGPWRLRFRGNLLLSEEEPGPTLSAYAPVFLTSDWIEVTIRDGKLARRTEVARRLFDVRPAGWMLSVSEENPDIHATLYIPNDFPSKWIKGFSVRIGTGAPDYDEELLGATRWGEAYFSNRWSGLDAAWPGCRSAIREALLRP